MNTNAIYSIQEDGRESHFYTSHAGGFSYPFHAESYLLSMRDNVNKGYSLENITACELVPLLKGNHNFPPEAEKRPLFTPLSEEQPQARFEQFAQEDGIPFHITLDLDSREVLFEFNKNCAGLSFPDVSIPLYGKESAQVFHDSANRDQMEAMLRGENAPVHEQNEASYKRCIGIYIQRNSPGETQDSAMQMSL